MSQRKNVSGSQSKTQRTEVLEIKREFEYVVYKDTKMHNGIHNNRSQLVPDEDEEDVNFSQMTSSQVQRARENFTPVQIDRKVAEVVQFILIKSQKKIPIRRAGLGYIATGMGNFAPGAGPVSCRGKLCRTLALEEQDIAKHVIKEYRAIYSEIINRAGCTFDQVFGLKLVEIDPKHHIYILINKLEAVPADPISLCPGNLKTGLLFVILSVIFMKGGVVKENLVWNTLKKLRVDPREKHNEFGDVKKVITDEFVRQKYLEYVRIPHTEPVEYEFRWGLRAENEVSKLKLLEFVAELHDQDPQSWTQQFREASTAGNSQKTR